MCLNQCSIELACSLWCILPVGTQEIHENSVSTVSTQTRFEQRTSRIKVRNFVA